MLPPPPFRILRTHIMQINTLQFSTDNEYVIVGDSSGRVTVTSTRTWRPVADWMAHADSVLGVQEWEGQIITHGRDNKLHIWRLAPSVPLLTDAAGSPTLASATITLSLDVNALNYCRFALCPIGTGKALLALPNLIESELIDVWELPIATRLHAAIGTIKGAAPRKPFSDDGRDIYKSGIVMSLQLSQTTTHLRVLAAYESGTVTLWTRALSDKPTSVEGKGWETAWRVKHHSEAVMGMAVTRDHLLAASISADHLICRYVLDDASDGAMEQLAPFETKYPGNGAIAFRADGRVLVTAGWDGAIRLYSTGRRPRVKAQAPILERQPRFQNTTGTFISWGKMRSLGALEYFKESCFAVAFANEGTKDDGSPSSSLLERPNVDGTWSDEKEVDFFRMDVRKRWLAAGGKNGRVAVWELDSFEKQ